MGIILIAVSYSFKVSRGELIRDEFVEKSRY
jgi:hypothetical protein